MTNRHGRPVSPLFLSAAERDYVERQVRRHRAPRSLSDGTTALFAALDVASGFVIGKCDKRPRAKAFLDFLKRIDAKAPGDPDIHVVMDLEADINVFIDKHNENPQPDKKSADEIIRGEHARSCD